MEGLRIYVLISCVPCGPVGPRGALKQHIRWSVNQNLRKGRLIVFVQPLSCGTAEIIPSHRLCLFPSSSSSSFFFPLPALFGFTAVCARGSLPLCARWPTSPGSPRGACSRRTAPSHCENCCFLFLFFFYHICALSVPSAQSKARRLLSCSVALKTQVEESQHEDQSKRGEVE